MLRSQIRAKVSALNNCEEEIKRHLFNEDFVLANGSKIHCQICTILVFDVALSLFALCTARMFSLRESSSHFPLVQVILCKTSCGLIVCSLSFQVSRTPSSFSAALKMDFYVMKALNPFSRTAFYYYHLKFRRHSKSSSTCALKSCFAPQFHSKRRHGIHHDGLNKAMV